jgi:hypothetical protein
VRDRGVGMYRSVGLSRTGCAPTNSDRRIELPLLRAKPLVGAHLCATAALGCTAVQVCRAQGALLQMGYGWVLSWEVLAQWLDV